MVMVVCQRPLERRKSFFMIIMCISTARVAVPVRIQMHPQLHLYLRAASCSTQYLRGALLHIREKIWTCRQAAR